MPVVLWYRRIVERFEPTFENGASSAERRDSADPTTATPATGVPVPATSVPAPATSVPARWTAAGPAERLRGLADRLRPLAAEPIEERLRDGLAWGVLALAAGLGTIAVFGGRVDSGVELSTAEAGPGGRPAVLVASVAPWSEAAAEGLEPGMVVVELNGQALFPIPSPGDSGSDGPLPYPVSLPAQIWSIQATWPWAIESLTAGRGGPIVGAAFWEATARLAGSWFVLFLGVALAVAVWGWLTGGRAGDRLRRFAWPAAAAVAGPLVLFPLQATASGLGYALTAVLLPATALPLADGLSGLVEDAGRRRTARIASGVAATAALAAGLLVLGGGSRSAVVAQWLAAALVAAVPGITAARAAIGGPLADGSPASGRVVEAIEAPALGLSPAFAALPLAVPGSGAFVAPLFVWLAGLLAAQRFTVRPLARLATRTALQRDLIVAATEAERARIAADIHDEVLQELTILVRQLDAAGASDAAATARRAAERLRAITGELRLPILDDLGVGPALEWLVARVERLAGGEVRLERDDGTRLPPEVELAFFRVAQEALANAVKHGRPPIVVRYRTSPTGATLSVDDSGPGIDPGAAEAARLGGHFGLLGMEQRAEQIGAILDVRRWPGGGTHVALEWRMRSREPSR